MPDIIETVRDVAETADRNAVKKEEEAVEVASQWAQEKLENFLNEVEYVALSLTVGNSDTKLIQLCTGATVTTTSYSRSAT